MELLVDSVNQLPSQLQNLTLNIANNKIGRKQGQKFSCFKDKFKKFKFIFP